MKLTLIRSSFSSDYAIIAYIFVIKILFHLLHPEYGYHRDELFYIAISDQFSFQNLDMLPLTPLVLKVFTTVFGYSIKSLHFASGLIGALTLLITCLITKELGGKKYAILLTGIFMLFSGFLIFGAIFTYDSLDILLSVFSIYLLVKLIKKDNPALWILLGITLGLGLFNKASILFLGLAIFICLWLVPQRRFYKGIWIWLAGLIALMFLIPWILWQIEHDWYFLSIAADYSGGVANRYSFPEYVWNQLLPNNIFSFPVWITGLGLLLFSNMWKSYRLFGFMYVFLFLLYFFIGAKFYFLMPMYSILLVIGSIKIEQFITNQNWKSGVKKIGRFVLPLTYLLLSLPLLPMIVPILPVEQLVKYTALVGIDAGIKTEDNQLDQLPQHIADKFGWEEMVVQTAHIYDSVFTELNDEVGIVTDNWGQASAIHLFGRKYNLPEPVSAHGWYYFQSLIKHNPVNNYISIGQSGDRLRTLFEEVRLCGVFTHPYCMPRENNKPIFLCKNPKFDLMAYWLVTKNINHHFLTTLRNHGVEAAINFYYSSREKEPRIPLFTERQINALGYEFLVNKQYDDAIALFELNLEVYPESYNVYDSLGEGYMENGQYELSIFNYKKSLEINPDNSNAVEKLKQLKELKQLN